MCLDSNIVDCDRLHELSPYLQAASIYYSGFVFLIKDGDFCAFLQVNGFFYSRVKTASECFLRGICIKKNIATLLAALEKCIEKTEAPI